MTNYVKRPLSPRQRELLEAVLIEHGLDAFPGGEELPLLAGELLDPVPLTVREYEVLVAVAHGLSNAAIAERLFIATETVKTHVRHLLGKLGARSRAHAVSIAYQHAILEVPDEA